MYKNLKFHSFLLYIFVMIFAIGCRGGGGQPPVTKPTQGDQPHAAQQEALVNTHSNNAADGRSDTRQEEKLREFLEQLKGDGSNPMHSVLISKKNLQKAYQDLHKGLEAAEQAKNGTDGEVDGLGEEDSAQFPGALPHDTDGGVDGRGEQNSGPPTGVHPHGTGRGVNGHVEEDDGTGGRADGLGTHLTGYAVDVSVSSSGSDGGDS